MTKTSHFALALFTLLGALVSSGPAQSLTLTVDATAPGKAISPDLVGVFFEDLSYAADGGLYAELVQNRSFEYSQLDRVEWNHLSFWEIAERGGRGTLSLDGSFPLHPNNPHYAVLQISQAGDVALINPGYDGIAVRASESYDFSVMARRLYTGGTWDRRKSRAPLPLLVRLEARDGTVLAQAELAVSALAWERLTVGLSPKASDEKARLVLVARDRGGLALDEISLFPRNTFKNRSNGLRADLAQAIADLKPKFVRFRGAAWSMAAACPTSTAGRTPSARSSSAAISATSGSITRALASAISNISSSAKTSAPSPFRSCPPAFPARTPATWAARARTASRSPTCRPTSRRSSTSSSGPTGPSRPPGGPNARQPLTLFRIPAR